MAAAVGGPPRDSRNPSWISNPRIFLSTILGRSSLPTSGRRPSKKHLPNIFASIEGTERYMAPEQGWNKVYGRSADCWALGCMYLELLAFGRNISNEYFQSFRQLHGGQECLASRNTCYRHNMKAVSLFTSRFLGNQSPAAESRSISLSLTSLLKGISSIDELPE
jgi:serine/threonine protein kinase